MLIPLVTRPMTTVAPAFDIAGPWDAIFIVLGLVFGALAGVTIHVLITKKNITKRRITKISIANDWTEYCIKIRKEK